MVINELEELDNYEWKFNDKNYKIKTENNENYGWLGLNVYENQKFIDIVSVHLNFVKFDPNDELKELLKYGLNISISSVKYLKLKTSIKNIKQEIEKMKNEYREISEKIGIYERHKLYEADIKETCCGKILTLFNILED